GHSDALRRQAVMTEISGDTEGAAELWFQVYWLFQSEEVSEEAEQRYLRLTGEDSMPLPEEGTDLAAYRHEYTAEELLSQIENEAAREFLDNGG
ncbi:MAG: hypothetical protein J6Z23_03685, partial [Lachnospiraceae bacterium]|nr:hypothetical protein [Lachnospiraceae bacterium]